MAFATSVITYFTVFAHSGVPPPVESVPVQVRDDREKVIADIFTGVADHQWDYHGDHICWLYFAMLFVYQSLRRRKSFLMVVG